MAWVRSDRERIRHGQFDAAQFENQTKAVDKMFQQHEALLSDEEWKAQNTRSCPNCKKPIERVSGCSSMVCPINEVTLLLLFDVDGAGCRSVVEITMVAMCKMGAGFDSTGLFVFFARMFALHRCIKIWLNCTDALLIGMRQSSMSPQRQCTQRH